MHYLTNIRTVFANSRTTRTCRKIKNTYVFLVMLGSSSFPDRHEVYGKTTEKFAHRWEQTRT